MLPDQPPQVLLESEYLRLIRHGHWEFVQRTNSHSAVIVLPLTDDLKVVFIEQFRIPLKTSVIEFPAGMVGDVPDDPREPPLAAAHRELLEETGYTAGRMTPAFSGACSGGMTDEVVTFFIARDLKKVGAGGGVDRESITLHEVPIIEADAWLHEQMRLGRTLDARLFTGLYLLCRELSPVAQSLRD